MHAWESMSEAQYADAALEAARRHAGAVAQREGRYRRLVGEPWLEGSPPQLVMLVADADGGRHERRFDLQVGRQPPVVAKYLVRDALARLPDALPAIARSCQEAWQDLQALAWPQAPELARVTVRREDAAPSSLMGPVAIRRRGDRAGEVLVDERHLFDFAPREFRAAQLWTCDGDLFRLTIDFGWGHVELRDP